MPSENILTFFITLFCALVFIALTVWCYKSKKPVNFWAGDKISANRVSDVKKYNRANGLMWLIYSFFWIAAAIVSLFNVKIAGICIGICCAGIIVLIIIYLNISKKYIIK
ncbi:MAG: hypothetical protein K6C97_07980 [Treponema sp.]|nr:hypothetical protein [Treponema sp.]